MAGNNANHGLLKQSDLSITVNEIMPLHVSQIRLLSSSESQQLWATTWLCYLGSMEAVKTFTVASKSQVAEQLLGHVEFQTPNMSGLCYLHCSAIYTGKGGSMYCSRVSHAHASHFFEMLPFLYTSAE